MAQRKKDLKRLFEARATAWIKEKCPWVETVVFDPMTWESGFNWQEKLEGNVTPEQAAHVYQQGISWEIEKVELQLKPNFIPREVYSNTWTAPPDSDLEVNEDWSQSDTVTDSLTIELMEELELGSELKTTAEFDIDAMLAGGKIGAEATSRITAKVGAGQTILHSEEKKVSFGTSAKFVVPKGKTYLVRYMFDQGLQDIAFTMNFVATGWMYWRTKPHAKDRRPHVYPWKIDPQPGPTHLGGPMPKNLRTFEVAGSYVSTQHTRGRFIITDETEADVTTAAVAAMA